MSGDDHGSMSSMEEGGEKFENSENFEAVLPRRSSRSATAASAARERKNLQEDGAAMATASNPPYLPPSQASSLLPSVPLSLPPPRSVEEMEAGRKDIRGMWEFASVLDFIHLFNDHILKIPVHVSAEELENEILKPVVGNFLKDVHITLLRQIHPPSRPPADRNTWATALTKKLSNAWNKLAEGECPLRSAQGAEESVYMHLSPVDRIRVLKALCELRLDQEDCHNFVDSSLKEGVAIEAFRLEAFGKDASGSIYWSPDAGELGRRMYKETPNVLGKGKRGTGRRANSPVPGVWETVATNLSEFQELAEKMMSARHKGEVKIGRTISETILPNLEELERRKEKVLKKQQRQALQLYESWNGPGLAAGRSRRERKVVNYTFDDYDRSINDAIKVTRKGRSALSEQGGFFREGQSEEAPASHDAALYEGGERGQGGEGGEGGEGVGRGVGGERGEGEREEGGDGGDGGQGGGELYDKLDQNGHVEGTFPQNNGGEFAVSATANSRRISRKPARLAQSATASSYEDSEESASDEEIAGEVEYTEEYEQARRNKQRKLSKEEDDEEYRGEEEEEDVEDDGDREDNDVFQPSDDDEFGQRSKLAKRGRGNKERETGGADQGMRRSSRTVKSHVDYQQLDGGGDFVGELSDGEEVGKKRVRVGRRRGSFTADIAGRGEASGNGEEHAGDAMDVNGGEREAQGHGIRETPSKPRSHGRGRSVRLKDIGVGKKDEEKGDNAETGRGKEPNSKFRMEDESSCREGDVGSEGDPGGGEDGGRTEFSEDDGDDYFSHGGQVRREEKERGERGERRADESLS